MSAPSIIMQPNEILITQSGSVLGITFDINPFQFGSIVKVNDLEDSYIVGQVVGYDPTGATTFIYNLVNYTVIEKDKIKFNEGYPL